MSHYSARVARLRRAAWTAFLAAMLAMTLAIWVTDGWLIGQRLLAQAGVLALVAIVASVHAAVTL